VEPGGGANSENARQEAEEKNFLAFLYFVGVDLSALVPRKESS
jgi:hypothetical protein